MSSAMIGFIIGAVFGGTMGVMCLAILIAGRDEEQMKEMCKNCSRCKPSYKGGICERTGKKVKYTSVCVHFWPKEKK